MDAFSSAAAVAVASVLLLLMMMTAVVLLVAEPEEAGRRRRGMGVEGASWRGMRRMIGRPTRARRYVVNEAARVGGVCGCVCR